MKQRFSTVVGHVKDLLASLAIVQSVTGAADATEAKAFIHEFATNSTTLPCFIVDPDLLNESWRASQFGGTVRVLINVDLAIPTAEQTTPATQAKWFWGVMESLLDQWEDEVNGSGQLVNLSRGMVQPPGPLDPDSLPAGMTNDPVWTTQFVCEVST